MDDPRTVVVFNKIDLVTNTDRFIDWHTDVSKDGCGIAEP